MTILSYFDKIIVSTKKIGGEKVEKISTTVGVFAGILDQTTGKLLLRRRVEEDSIIPGKSFKSNWELPGGGVMDMEKISYNHLLNELAREVDEEVGISVSVDPMAPLYAVLFKGPAGYDLAVITPITTSSSPTKGETILVSTEELEKLAKDFASADKKKGIDGKGIVSGYGKRMHCMALKALSSSPNVAYSEEAKAMLAEIQKGW